MAFIPRKIAPRRQEWSVYHTQRDSGAPLKAHKDQTTDARQLNALTELVIQHGKRIKELESRPVKGFGFYPFRLYSLPSPWLPTTASADPAGFDPINNWRTLQVRAGCVLTSYIDPLSSSLVAGTDLVRYPDTDLLPPLMLNQILVPISSSKYWVWIEKLNNPVTQSFGSVVKTYYTIRHGNDPSIVNTGSYNNGPIGNPAPPTWTNWPSASATHFMIGYCDTISSASINQMYTRQLIRDDITDAGGNFVSMSVCIDGSPQVFFFNAFKSGSAGP